MKVAELQAVSSSQAELLCGQREAAGRALRCGVRSRDPGSADALSTGPRLGSGWDQPGGRAAYILMAIARVSEDHLVQSSHL